MTHQPYYETMYILRPDIPEEEVETHLKKYSDILVEGGGEVLDNQMRGKRRLAYPIAKHKEGIYVQLSHKGDGQHINVIEKAMRLSEDVIRYLTVKQEGPLPTPRVAANNESGEEESKKKSTQDKSATESNTEAESKTETEEKVEAETKKDKKEEAKPDSEK